MSEIGRLEAARNNADWCEAVCAAHGDAGERVGSHWLSRAVMPRLYPNLVTLRPESDSGALLARIRELGVALAGREWAVKDSFGEFALEAFGFRRLLDGEWVVREVKSERAVRGSRRWGRIATAAELAVWELAWGESAGRARVFLPPLLARDDVAVLGAFDEEERIVAGVIANRSERVVGVTNFFAEARAEEALRASIEAATEAFPGVPVVGWGAGTELAALKRIGFRGCGRLAVWVANYSRSGDQMS